ncbi:MAG: DNA topoisomerase IB [Verrucomicrobiales bacterium]
MARAATSIKTESKIAIKTDSGESARAAGLLYICDNKPGIRRIGSPKQFSYLDSKGNQIKEEEALLRIRKLAIPPAWTDVWICSKPNGHLQATGKDARGRKQYRYHPSWREVRDQNKYNRMIQFASALPSIRKVVNRDLKAKKLSREKVLATVIKILETGLIRVGNEEYVKQNHSFGLTTMQDRHVKVKGSTIQFQFKGKSGKFHNIDIEDRYLARIVKQCQDLPGQDLFQYIDESGKRRDVTSTDVNEYLRAITKGDFTAKDFRTWGGTVLAAMALKEMEKVDSKTQAKKNVMRAIESVAQKLGNTPSICRKCYIHPVVIESYLEGTMIDTFKKRADQGLRSGLHQLGPEEAAVLAFLQQRLTLETSKKRPNLMQQLKASLNHRKARRKRKP